MVPLVEFLWFGDDVGSDAVVKCKKELLTLDSWLFIPKLG